MDGQIEQADKQANSFDFNQLHRRLLIIGFTAILAMLTYLFLPASIDEYQRRMIAIFIVAAVFWATEALPLFATSMLITGMLILFLCEKGGLFGILPSIADVSASTEAISYTAFLDEFSSPIIMLFMGGFLLSSALTKHNIDKKIAATILKPFTNSPALMLAGVLGITAFFSIWMSNTATAAMMLAIMAPIFKNSDKNSPFTKALILAVPFGANIGGIGTPIGTPPNAVAFQQINNMLGAKGLEQIGFMDWMKFAVPLEVLLLVFVGVLLYFFYPASKEAKKLTIETAGKISFKGWITLIILAIGVALWLTGKVHGIHSGVVALMIAIALCSVGLLDRKDVDTIDWNILILMWGGLAMGVGLKVSGTTNLVSSIPFDAMPGGELAIAGGLPTLIQLAILTSLACSFAMALPVSTPPNAMAFATGRLPVKSLLKSGTVISAVAIVVMLVGYRFMIPLMLNLTGMSEKTAQIIP